MLYISAGHHFNPNGEDPGACANDVHEADLTADLRNLIALELCAQGASFILDKDSETLSQYIKRIKPGSGSVLCDIHFNASVNPNATGTEVLVKDSASITERKIAADLCRVLVETCGLVNRGVKTESQSHRGRLGILHTKAGISVLIEVCFISNLSDLQLYRKNKGMLAYKIAQVLIHADSIAK